MHVQLSLLAVPPRPPLIDDDTRRIGRRGLKDARAALNRSGRTGQAPSSSVASRPVAA